MSGLHIVERVIRFTRWPIHYCHEMMTVTIAFQLSNLRIDSCMIVNGYFLNINPRLVQFSGAHAADEIFRGDLAQKWYFSPGAFGVRCAARVKILYR